MKVTCGNGCDGCKFQALCNTARNSKSKVNDAKNRLMSVTCANGCDGCKFQSVCNTARTAKTLASHPRESLELLHNIAQEEVIVNETNYMRNATLVVSLLAAAVVGKKLKDKMEKDEKKTKEENEVEPLTITLD